MIDANTNLRYSSICVQSTVLGIKSVTIAVDIHRLIDLLPFFDEAKAKTPFFFPINDSCYNHFDYLSLCVYIYL